MPEFKMEGKDSIRFSLLDAFTRGYIEAAFFTEEDQLEEDGVNNPGFYDLAPVTLVQMLRDAQKFQCDNEDLIHKALFRSQGKYTAAHAGHDFWLTRNRHGEGFWDRQLGEIGAELTKKCEDWPEVSLYRGDDGLIYA